MSLRALVHFLTCTSLGVAASQALVLRTFDATRHLRFLGFPSNPTHNTQFLHSAYDFTGVGWLTTNTQRQLTMVSPLHYVGANHVRVGVGSTLRFLSSDGVIRDYTVASETTIPNDAGNNSDLFVGTLTAAITESDNIRFYPYLNLSSNSNYNAYRNQPLIILGRTVLGGSGVSSSIKTVSSTTTQPTLTITSTYIVASGSADDSYYQSGDSGGPVFINQGGIPAIVGTNSLVGSSTDSSNNVVSFTNFANFIPHYIDDLNNVMEVNGYRMTKAIPGSTTLTLTHTPPPSPIRAGHSFNIQLNLANTGSTMAENIRLNSTFPNNSVVTSTSGSPWFDQPFVNTATSSSRSASINPSSTSDYSITLTIPDPGSYDQSVTYSSDQSSAMSQVFNLDVIESFLSWTNTLTDGSPTGDDDQDGINNLLEYAFGGNPANSSQLVDGDSTPLLPSYSSSNGVHTISYVRRKDYVQRALDYQLTSSTTLGGGSFSDASTLINTSNTTSINDELELVSYTLTQSGTKRFFRIEVSLNE